VQSAGQLVTTYAISSPLLTTFTGSVGRRKLLITAMVAFAFANIVAASAIGFASLAGARFLLAMRAGLYTPSATALAGDLAPHGKRGLALAIVSGGTCLAIALGVPIGALVGTPFGRRMTFLGVAALSFAATVAGDYRFVVEVPF